MSSQETVTADEAVDEQRQLSEGKGSTMRAGRAATGAAVLFAGAAVATVLPLLVASSRRGVAEAVLGGASISLLGAGMLAGRGRRVALLAWGGSTVAVAAIAWGGLAGLFPVVPVLAWALVVLCALRAEHVWASDVWIAQSGEEFTNREAQARESNRIALLSAGKPATWRDALLTPEQRWKLYVETGGGKMPWLFLGIRSHRLLVAARRSGRIGRPLLMLARSAWLNWLFPVLAGAAVLLILIMDHSHNSRHLELHTAAFLSALFLCVNTLGAFVGAACSAITMKGLARHHDSWKMEDAAKARAIAEIGYALAATALFVLSCVVLIQVLVAASSAAAGSSGISAGSLTASLSFALQGANSAALHLSSQAIHLLEVIRYVIITGSALAWGIILYSARQMAWPGSDS